MWGKFVLFVTFTASAVTVSPTPELACRFDAIAQVFLSLN